MASITLERVTKRFRDGTVAVRDLDLGVRDGELMVLVGPSGCGKSTVLRMVAGLERPSEGTIRLDGRHANDLSPGERDVAMVFQDYALYPHMTVRQNMAFALGAKRLPRSVVDQRVDEAARSLGIDRLLRRRPAQLSGGERQRVAMGRAIVRKPAAFLMDEPLSNLDARLRSQMRSEIRRLHRELGTTFVYVTHDQVEAMTMGERVAVMRRGELQQVGSGQEIYARPANIFVAAFIGNPPASLILADVERRDGRATARVGPWSVPISAAAASENRLVVGIRPEHLLVAGPEADDGDGRISAEMVVDEVEPLGGISLLHFQIDARGVVASDAVGPSDGTSFSLGDAPAHMVAQVDGRSAARAEMRISVALDGDRALLFSAETGRVLSS